MFALVSKMQPTLKTSVNLHLTEFVPVVVIFISLLIGCHCTAQKCYIYAAQPTCLFLPPGVNHHSIFCIFAGSSGSKQTGLLFVRS